MRNIFPFLATLVIAGALASGCANTEKKLGRGMSNMTEFARLGEMRRSIEQTALFDQPGGHYATGFIRGLTKTFARTGVGIYEVVTAPFPPYDPVLHRLPLAQPRVSGQLPARTSLTIQCLRRTTDMGFSGGDIAPYIPGQPVQDFQHPLSVPPGSTRSKQRQH